MNIGIITFHRAHNYGAVLQCYALKEILQGLGHDVSVIDYRQPEIERRYKYQRVFSIKSFILMSLKDKLKYISTNYSLPKKFYRERKAFFEDFNKKYLNLSEACSVIPDIYDTIIIGSDMMWADLCKDGNFDPIYLGSIAHCSKHKIIGYAISGTPASMECLGQKTSFKFLKNFNAVSLREDRLADIVRKYTTYDIKVCLDPTLLSVSSHWDKLINPNWSKRNYVLTYYLRVPQEDRKTIDDKIADKFVNEDYEIFDIDSMFTTKPTNVEDFLSMIKYAKYIVTDSFHGIAFSIIFHTPFHAICMNDSGDVRYTNILETLGLEHLLVERTFSPFIPTIDFTEADIKRMNLANSSIEYLKKNV